MMRTVAQSPLTLVLAAAAGTGLLALTAALLPTPVWSDAFAPPAPHHIAVPIIDVPPIEAYAPIADAPLFVAGRQKAPQGAAGGKPGQIAPLSDYRLAGLVIARDVRLGLVARRSGGQPVVVHPGDTLDGRHVDDVTADGVALSGAGGVELLTMPKPRTGGWSILKPPAIKP